LILRKYIDNRIDIARKIGPQAIGPVGIGIFVAKLNTLMNEKIAYRMNNQRIVLFSLEEEKRGATNTDASDEKKPHPKTSRASITEPVE